MKRDEPVSPHQCTGRIYHVYGPCCDGIDPDVETAACELYLGHERFEGWQRNMHVSLSAHLTWTDNDDSAWTWGDPDNDLPAVDPG
jgi:hypothetical protein